MKRTLVLVFLAFSTLLFGYAQAVVVNPDGPVTAPGLHVTGDVGYVVSGQLQQRTEAGVAGGNVIFNGEPLIWAESGHPGATVKGAPYSATAVTEVTQVLGDGNRILNKNSSELMRDSEGRTRTEESLGLLGRLPVDAPNMILINDPVSGNSYTLETRSRTAHVLHYGGRPETLAFEKFKTDMKAHTERSQTELKQVNREDLGSQEIEGIVAQGTRTTITIPAGQIGNERPLQITNEVWFSPDLKIIVLSKRNDPRFGETVYRLTTINRAEPDPSFFQVPAGYSLDSSMPRIERRAIPKE
jgi:hypothetical protein